MFFLFFLLRKPIFIINTYFYVISYHKNKIKLINYNYSCDSSYQMLFKNQNKLKILVLKKTINEENKKRQIWSLTELETFELDIQLSQEIRTFVCKLLILNLDINIQKKGTFISSCLNL